MVEWLYWRIKGLHLHTAFYPISITIHSSGPLPSQGEDRKTAPRLLPQCGTASVNVVIRLLLHLLSIFLLQANYTNWFLVGKLHKLFFNRQNEQ